MQSWRLHDGAADLVTYEQLKRIGDWQLTEEAQRSALAELVSAIADLDTSSRWGEGRTAASDGQRFSLPRRVLQQTYSTRFSDFALEFYTFVADNYAPFHSLPIECTDRDAAFVLDGLLYNESELEIEEHYTDTHGYTEISFAPFAMPGLRFCPRIRGVQHRRIYRINPNCDYGLLTSLVSRSDQTIDTAQIAEQWDRMGQLYASLKTGNVTASVALKLKKQRIPAVQWRAISQSSGNSSPARSTGRSSNSGSKRTYRAANTQLCVWFFTWFALRIILGNFLFTHRCRKEYVLSPSHSLPGPTSRPIMFK